jgi:hypothetical protein
MLVTTLAMGGRRSIAAVAWGQWCEGCSSETQGEAPLGGHFSSLTCQTK